MVTAKGETGTTLTNVQVVEVNNNRDNGALEVVLKDQDGKQYQCFRIADRHDEFADEQRRDLARARVGPMQRSDGRQMYQLYGFSHA